MSKAQHGEEASTHSEGTVLVSASGSVLRGTALKVGTEGRVLEVDAAAELSLQAAVAEPNL